MVISRSSFFISILMVSYLMFGGVHDAAAANSAITVDGDTSFGNLQSQYPGKLIDAETGQPANANSTEIIIQHDDGTQTKVFMGNSQPRKVIGILLAGGHLVVFDLTAMTTQFPAVVNANSSFTTIDSIPSGGGDGKSSLPST